MIFFIIVLGLLCLWKIKYEQRGDYLNVYRTNSIKGIFIILIFFSHITNDYVSFGGELAVPYYMLKKILGQCVVCLFLFYSGYAMLHKLTTEEDYCKNIPTRRILTTLLRFDAAIVLFALYGMYKGTKYSIKRMVLTFLGWNGIGNSNWYIFCILCLYLFTYIAFTVFSNKKKAVTAVTLLTIIYMGIVNKYQGSWWWDTALCYSLGMWFYIYKEKIHEIIDENFKTWITSFFISLAMFTACYLNKGNVWAYQVMVISFTCMVVIFTMHIAISNKILAWCGENLFELYILQRIPMIILKDIGLAEVNGYVYVIVCLILTIVISVVFKRCISRHICFHKR